MKVDVSWLLSPMHWMMMMTMTTMVSPGDDAVTDALVESAKKGGGGFSPFFLLFE